MDTKSESIDTANAELQQPPEKISPTGMASIQGEVKSHSDWMDRGILDVPVEDLPDPEGVSNPADFNHHITWEDAQAATTRLPDIQKQVHAGKTGHDFSDSDQAKGLSYQQGERRIFDLYYGSDPIKLDKDGSEYTVVSGRHRIFAAKETGLKTIPARVSEKVST
jgi:hypothetical protein